jgi:hypothetical protein
MPALWWAPRLSEDQHHRGPQKPAQPAQDVDQRGGVERLAAVGVVHQHAVPGRVVADEPGQ